VSIDPEDIPSLYHSFYERIDKQGKKQQLIVCRVCQGKDVPSHSTNSDVCEMCFEDDFWDHYAEQKQASVARLWVAKAKEEFVFADSYYPKGSYLGYQDSSVDSLGQARFFQNKSEVMDWVASSGESFVSVEIELRESP